jgi:uncharacterized membrane protein
LNATLGGYLVTSACGWAVAPLLRRLLDRLPDRGHGVSRVLGLVLATIVAFRAADFLGRPLNRTLAIGAIALLALFSGLASRLLPVRNESGASITPAKGKLGAAIAWEEGLFLLGVVLFAWIQSHNPSVDPDSERFMDYAFLRSYLRTPGLPAPDPWFAGAPMNYYSFTYAVAAFLVRAAGGGPAAMFTAIVAILSALIWSTAFGIGLALTGRTRGGLLASFLVLGAGNLQWIAQWVHRGGLFPFDWFAPARAITGAITEFPWFSLLWGDLHPYILGLALVLAALAFPLASLETDPPGRASIAKDAARWAVFGLLAAATLAAHPWDVPALLMAALAAVLLGRERHRLVVAGAVLAAPLVALPLMLPFLRGFRQQGRRLALVTERTAPAEWAMAYGPFVLLSLIGLVGWASRRRGAAGVPSDAPGRRRCRVAAGFAGVALLLAAACEVVYVPDIFASTPLARMNTIFKQSRLVWLLLAVASPVLVEWLLGRVRRRRVVPALILMLALASVYPVFGTAAWLQAHPRPASTPFGAESLFRQRFPGDAAAARFVARHARSGDVVLEETGDAYTWSSRIATFSGVPCVLGWGNHEAGWRDDWGTVVARRADVESIYLDPLSARAQDRLKRYGVMWIILGDRERRRYGEGALAGLDGLGSRRFEEQGTIVYRIGAPR